MKQILLIVFLLTAGVASAQPVQHPDTLSLICRKWKPEFTDESLLGEMDSTERERLKKAFISFAKDKTYISFIDTVIVEKGTWKYIPDQRRLICTSLGKENATIIIINSISENEINGRAFTNLDEEKYTIVLRAIK